MRVYLLTIALFIGITTVFISCKNNSNNATYECPMNCEGTKTYTKPGICPVCKMDLVEQKDIEKPVLANPDSVSELSIFNLTTQWKTQNNQDFKWVDMQGETFILAMIYTSCKAACPRLVADMKSIAEKVAIKNVKYVLVSIDPETDTPEVLKKFAEENNLDNQQWILLHGTLDDVRELSNVVAVKYVRISPLDFSHSNIISLFNTQGVLSYQQEGLGVDNNTLVAKTKELVGN